MSVAQRRREPLTSPTDIPNLRYRSQLLAGSPFDDPADTVAWFGAMQAQDYAAALWAVGQRTPGATEHSVEQALADGRIVRTWPLRGTLHLVAAQDVHWLLALLGPRMVARSARRFVQLGLDERVVERARQAFARALAGGARLTRPEMRRVLDGAGVDTAGQRGYHLLWRCAVEGLLCLGPRQGKQHTFVLLDEWVPPGQAWTRDEALAEVARRYAQAHGPATVRDLTWWSGLAAAEARRAAGLAGDGLVTEGDTLGSPRTAADEAAPRDLARLLPAFDEYLVGYRNRTAVLDPQQARQVNAGGGMLGPTVVVGARVVGVWKRTLTGRRVRVQARVFRALSLAERRALAADAEAYGRFLGREAELSIEKL